LGSDRQPVVIRIPPASLPLRGLPEGSNTTVAVLRVLAFPRILSPCMHAQSLSMHLRSQRMNARSLCMHARSLSLSNDTRGAAPPLGPRATRRAGRMVVSVNFT
jgi:hypothetical protein